MTDVLKQIAVMEARMAELKTIATEQAQHKTQSKESGKDDAALLHECLDALQHATYHDGRYGQFLQHKWQEKAQALVSLLAKRLGRVEYEGY